MRIPAALCLHCLHCLLLLSLTCARGCPNRRYWNPQWTAMVVLAFCIMPVCKFGGAMRLPPYDTEKLCKGFGAGLGAAACFLVGLDDQIDPFRLFHGLSQALVGLALYYLWQLVPLNIAKKTDEDGSQEDTLQPLPAHSGSRGLGRVMSVHDLPVSRLEYY